MKFLRSIDLAYDRDTGECYDAATSFKVAKEAHELRKRYNAGELNLGCYRCDQPCSFRTAKMTTCILSIFLMLMIVR